MKEIEEGRAREGEQRGWIGAILGLFAEPCLR